MVSEWALVSAYAVSDSAVFYDLGFTALWNENYRSIFTAAGTE